MATRTHTIIDTRIVNNCQPDPTTVSGMNRYLQSLAFGLRHDKTPMAWDFIANSDGKGRGSFSDIEAGLIEIYYESGNLHSRWQISFEPLMGEAGAWSFKEVRK